MASTPAPPRAELARSHTPLLAGGSTRRSAAPESSAPQQKGGWRTLLAGGGAGAIDCFVTMPMDTLSTQMQLKRFSSPIATAEAVIAAKGIAGLYAGFVPFLQVELS